jgi:uncharacterized repeat protein (TIGR01451 family)
MKRIDTPGRRLPREHATVVTVIAALLLLAGVSASASAAPTWRLDSLANSTAAPGEMFRYVVELRNMGDIPADGSVSPITFTGTLPAGLTVSSAFSNSFSLDCSSVVAGGLTFSCSDTSGQYEPRLPSVVLVDVTVDPGVAEGTVLTSQFAITGGDPADPSNPTANIVDATTVSSVVPGFGVDAFDGQVTADAAGAAITQAGGHPYDVSTSIDFNTATNPAPAKGAMWPREPVRDVLVELPAGFVGNPTVAAQCTLPQLVGSGEGTDVKADCPSDSQVGVTFVHTLVLPLPFISGGAGLGPVPVYNMTPPPDAPARFGFNVAGTIVTLDASLRSGSDYGLTVEARNIPEGLAIAGTSLTFWGVPSDGSHDAQRSCPGSLAPWQSGASICPSGAARKAFLRLPTSCTAPGVGLTTTARVDSWFHPGDFRTASFDSHLPPAYPLPSSEWGARTGTTGCDRVPFDPRLSAKPISASAGKPSAFTFDISLPQSDDPGTPSNPAIAQSDLKKAVVRLPLGVRVNPASAAGLGACSPTQIGLHSKADPSCPDSSKLGSVTIDTPLLDRPVEGSIYLAGPHDNPFDTLLAVYLVAKGPGVLIKLPGKIEADQMTGQLTSTFDDNPQLPFENLHLAFKDGPRAALVNPRTCGPATTTADLTSWSGKTVHLESTYAVSRDGRGALCAGPRFLPRFSAGTESNGAGSSSSFLLRMTREDEDQGLSELKVKMPRGLTGKIASADLCTSAQVGADACPANSKIGDVTTGAGAGPDPFYITNGRAYLTGPYKGAPFGVAIVVPAVAGPFDLGKVTVRSALFVDKKTAEVSIVSDQFPQILQGIPLDVRDVRVNVNKPNFFLNPTSCAEKAITGTITSTEGAKANVSDRFQAAECASLVLKPKLGPKGGGRGHTRRGQTTPFSTTLRMPTKGQTNLRFVRVTLPKTINARLTVINDACTRAEFESNVSKCTHAKAGTAVASTPLLRDPLRGSVYFVKNGHPIPDLFVALRGQVDFDLVGRISIPGGKRLATTFDSIPDVPVRSFSLRLFGDAKNGSVGAAANLCSKASRRQKVEIDYIGQNGKVLQTAQPLKVAGCGKQKKPRHGRKH